MHCRRLGEQSRDCGFAAAGRAPQDHRGKPMSRNHAPDRRVRRQQMILADDVAQLLRPEPVGKRPRCRILEKALALTTARIARRAHRTLTAKSCPPRRMPKVQGPWLAPKASFSSLTDATGARLTVAMISPGCSPTRSARLPLLALTTTTPRSVVASPSSSACAGLRLATVAPPSGVSVASAETWRDGVSGS